MRTGCEVGLLKAEMEFSLYPFCADFKTHRCCFLCRAVTTRWNRIFQAQKSLLQNGIEFMHHTHIYGKTKSLHGLNIHVRIISSCSNDFCHFVPLLLLRCYCRRCCDNEWWMNCWWPCRLSNVIELSSKTGLLLGHHSTDGWEERSGNWVSLSRRWRQRE